MHVLLDLHFDKCVVFTMILARVGAMVLSAPVFGARSIPIHIRLLLVVSLAALIAPLQWHVGIVAPATLSGFLVALLTEVLIGLTLGLAILILFSSMEIAGRLVAQTGGSAVADFGGGEISSSSPVPARLLQILALGVFVGISGHRMLMAAILDSFQALPPAGGGLPSDMLGTMTLLISESFQMAARTAAPAVTAILTATLLIGLASRAIPQLNSFTIGFAINIWATLLGLLLSIGAIAYLFSDQLDSYLAIWRQSLL